MTIRSETIAVTTTGSAGSATGTATSPRIVGEVLGIDVNYHASAPATTDLTITADAVSGGQAARNLLVLTNVNSDGYYQPAVPLHDSAGAAVTYDGTNEIYKPPVVNSTITVSIAGADALTNCATVTIHYRR